MAQARGDLDDAEGLVALERYSEAAERLQEAHTVLAAAYGEDHPAVVAVAGDLAALP